MNRGRRDVEVTLEVSFCRGPTIHFRIGIDEGEILALQTRELGHPFMMSRRPTFGVQRRAYASPLQRRG